VNEEAHGLAVEAHDVEDELRDPAHAASIDGPRTPRLRARAMRPGA
jgi:hypothetical protein